MNKLTRTLLGTVAPTIFMALSTAYGQTLPTPKITAFLSPADGMTLTQFAPYELVEITGTGLSSGVATNYAGVTQYATQIDGTRVLANGVPCPLLFVSPDAVVFQLPQALTTSLQVELSNADNTVTNKSTVRRVKSTAVEAHLFTSQIDGGIPTLQITNQATGVVQGSQDNPLVLNQALGTDVIFHVTGSGVYNVAIIPGYTIPPTPLPYASTVPSYSMTVDGGQYTVTSTGEDYPNNGLFLGTWEHVGQNTITALMPKLQPGFHMLTVNEVAFGGAPYTFNYPFFSK